MGAELGVLSRQKSSKPNQNPNSSKYQPNHHRGSWMWNTKQVQDDNDSWEVRAFAEDTGNILGATWPPRSYTCTFCRREFRSAQALGGHMNVHRRDRARLHQAQSPAASSPSSSPSSTFIYPKQDFPASTGVCYRYQIPNPNNGPTPFDISPSSTLLPISPYSARNRNNFLGKSLNFPESSPHHLHSSNVDFSAIIDKSKTNIVSSPNNNKRKDLANDPEPELDLELRLGHRSRKAMIWPDRR